MTLRSTTKRWLLTVIGAATTALITPSVSSAASSPADDPFYQYTGSTPLADIAPGTVLNTRTIDYKRPGHRHWFESDAIAVPLHRCAASPYRERHHRGQAQVRDLPQQEQSDLVPVVLRLTEPC